MVAYVEDSWTVLMRYTRAYSFKLGKYDCLYGRLREGRREWISNQLADDDGCPLLVIGTSRGSNGGNNMHIIVRLVLGRTLHPNSLRCQVPWTLEKVGEAGNEQFGHVGLHAKGVLSNETRLS